MPSPERRERVRQPQGEPLHRREERDEGQHLWDRAYEPTAAFAAAYDGDGGRMIYRGGREAALDAPNEGLCVVRDGIELPRGEDVAERGVPACRAPHVSFEAKAEDGRCHAIR